MPCRRTEPTDRIASHAQPPERTTSTARGADMPISQLAEGEPLMCPLLIWLLAVAGVFLVLPLLAVATGLACARRMPSVSRAYGLLSGCVCDVAVAALMFFRPDALLWLETQFGVHLPWPLPFLLLTVAIGVAGILATAGIGRLRRAGVLPPEPTVTQS